MMFKAITALAWALVAYFNTTPIRERLKLLAKIKRTKEEIYACESSGDIGDAKRAQFLRVFLKEYKREYDALLATHPSFQEGSKSHHQEG